MKLWILTLAHASSDVFCHTINELYSKSVMLRHRDPRSIEHVVVDHHWPLNRGWTKRSIITMSEMYGFSMMSPYKNLGGAEGYKWAMANIPIEDEDYILFNDPDVASTLPHFDQAMFNVLTADPKVLGVFLSDERVYAAPGRNWTTTTIAGHSCKEADNFSVTDIGMLRAGFIKKAMRGITKFYGYVEEPIWRAAKEQGGRIVYLENFTQTQCPIAHPAEYTRWKIEHAHKFSFSGNFDQWCKEKGLS